MSEDLSRLPIRRSGIELRDKGGDIVLAEVGRTETYALNPMARAVWELCDGTTTIEELADAICQIFEVARPTARSDVMTVLDQLDRADLVYWPDEDA